MKLISATLVTALLLSPVINASQDHHHDESPEEHAKHAHESHDHDHDGHDHEHDKPKYGGIVAEAGGQHFELVINGETIALYAEDLPHDHDADAIKIRLTILQGKKRSQLELQASKTEEHRFESAITQQLKAGDKIVAMVRSPKSKPILVKFDVAD
jgi:ABC-type Zn2+ transport system substrate-binding protein/surface adhesin